MVGICNYTYHRYKYIRKEPNENMSNTQKRNRDPSPSKKFLVAKELSKDINTMNKSKNTRYFLKNDQCIVDDIQILLYENSKLEYEYRNLDKSLTKTKTGYKIQYDISKYVSRNYMKILDKFQFLIFKRDLVRKDDNLSNALYKVKKRYIKIIRIILKTNDEWIERKNKLRSKLK